MEFLDKTESIFKKEDSVVTKEGRIGVVYHVDGTHVTVLFNNTTFTYEQHYLRYMNPKGIKQTRDNLYLDLIEAKLNVSVLEKTLKSWDCLVEQIKVIEH